LDRRSVAEAFGELALDDRRLPARDPLADDERRDRLVRGVEAHRSEELVLPLEPAHDRVALTDCGPAGAVVIQRQGARGLPEARRQQLLRSIGTSPDDAIGVL